MTVNEHAPGSEDPGDGVDLLAGQRTEPPPRGRARRIAVVLTALVALLLALVTGSGFLLTEHIGGNIERVPGVFAGLDATVRPAADQGMTFLLVGTDSRSPEPTTGTAADAPAFVPGRQRSDVIMLARVSPDRASASIVSLPRDSWVDLPGRGKNKINAAYSLGGPALLVRTVEGLTGLHVDHLAVVDFAGFEAVIDSVGGIDVAVAQATSHFGVEFHQGVNHLDGRQALAYVRQRMGLPGGDLARAQRHKNVLRAVLDRVSSRGVLSDPIALVGFLEAMSRSVGVDDSLSNSGLRSLAFGLRDLRPSAITYLNAPVSGLGQEGPQSVVYLDRVRCGELWTAVRAGTAASYAQRHPGDALANAPA